VECPSCLDRKRVSLLRKWRWTSEQEPAPPRYRVKPDTFTEVRRIRIALLRDEVLKGMERVDPSLRTSDRLDLLPALAAALEDEDGKIRAHAMLAVAEMNHEKAFPVLLAALKHDDSNVQSHACRGLERLGRPHALREAVVSALTQVADSGEENEFEVRLEAASALFELGELRSADLFVEALKLRRRSVIARKVIVQFQRKDVILLLVRWMVTVPPNQTDEFGQDLERLTGEKFGDDPVRWYRWFEKNRASLPTQLE
jgi:hypothetical protein